MDKFEDMVAWQKPHDLTAEIYRLSQQERLREDSALQDQMVRAAISIMANIAEGFERDGTGEFVQFLAIAKASSAEVLSHAYVALDQAFITQKQFDELASKAAEVNRMIAGLMTYLRRSGTRGLKFKAV